ncbi:hypothetical protein WKW79_35590 [Variovorax robiniae]|uniref:Uncharacterized protein n=1 Tax=Variovorax robiniae TaxID=1836199 RepID=A0ABU8XJB0_9BURK
MRASHIAWQAVAHAGMDEEFGALSLLAFCGPQQGPRDGIALFAPLDKQSGFPVPRRLSLVKRAIAVKSQLSGDAANLNSRPSAVLGLLKAKFKSTLIAVA